MLTEPPEGISVIVPVFNREDWIVETIESVLTQNYHLWELILVDDGSTDQSISVCKKYAAKDERICLIERNSPLKGASVCRNIGLHASKYKWIIFLDSDDLLATWCMTQRMDYLCKSDFIPDFAVFPMLYFKKKPDDMRILQNINTEIHPLDRFLQRENVWLMSSVIWRKEFFMSIGGFHENALSFQDWEINVRALVHSDKWKFYDDTVPDNFYRQHENTVSASRFTSEHISNNLETFIFCYGEFEKSNHFSEKRKSYFKKLIFEWLKRFSGIEMLREERVKLRIKYLDKSIQCNLISQTEKEFLVEYLKISDNPVFIRFRFLFRLRVIFMKSKLKLFLLDDSFVKNQGKPEFKGKLNYAKQS